MNLQMLMAMIPGAEGFKTQGLELLKSAHELVAAVDIVVSEVDQLSYDRPATAEAITKMENANIAFKANLAKLPPMPGE